MRGVAMLAALLALSACQQEPDFDERYAQASKNLEEKAAAIERDLADPHGADRPEGSTGGSTQ